MRHTEDMPLPSSPNHDERRLPVSMIVLHYTDLPDLETAYARLCDPAAKVSAHYLIGRDGQCHALVAEDRRAWHAGVSSWRGITDVNSAALGIELENPGHSHGYRPFPALQIARTIALCQELVARHGIAPADIIGHQDVAPARKQDPGPLFPWSALAAAGVGLWPDEVAPPLSGAAMPAALRRYGYALPDATPAALAAVLRAFQTHFLPEQITGLADAATCRALASLLAQSGR